jgi:hypothetical protein
MKGMAGMPYVYLYMFEFKTLIWNSFVNLGEIIKALNDTPFF